MHRKTPVFESFLIKLQTIKKEIPLQVFLCCFLVNFAKFLTTLFFEHLQWLLLHWQEMSLILACQQNKGEIAASWSTKNKCLDILEAATPSNKTLKPETALKKGCTTSILWEKNSAVTSDISLLIFDN